MGRLTSQTSSLFFVKTIFFSRGRRSVGTSNSSSTYVQMEEALQLFDQMLESKPKPNISKFNTLFTKIMKTKNPSSYVTLISLYNKMNRVGGVSPNIVTFTIFIDCCGRMRKTDLGFAIFGSMLRRGWSGNTITFNSLIRGLCEEKRVVEAARLLEEKRVVRCFLERGEIQKALEFLHHMHEHNFFPEASTSSLLVDLLQKDGKYHEYMKLFPNFSQQHWKSS